MNSSYNSFSFSEMMQMFMHWDEDSRAQFSNEQYQFILRRLNDLASEFGRSWVEHLAGVKKSTDPMIITASGNDNVGAGAIGIMRAAQFGEDWNLVKNCPGASNLNVKLLVGYDNQNVDLEVNVAAAFARCGATFEFGPMLQTGKVSDIRVQLDDGNWLYVEVSRRVSNIPELEAAVETLLGLCLNVAPGRACSLHIKGDFDKRSFESIKLWLEGLINAQAPSSTLDGIADFWSFDHGVDMTTEILKSHHGPLTFISKGDARTSTFATVYYYVLDPGFENKFEEERSQLPANGIGVIVIDVTGIPGNMERWVAKSLEELNQPDNAHILGVVMLAKFVDGASFPRWRFHAKFATNPRIQDDSFGPLRLIERAFSSSCISYT